MGFKGWHIRVPDSNCDVNFRHCPQRERGSDSIYGTRPDFIIARGRRSVVCLPCDALQFGSLLILLDIAGREGGKKGAGYGRMIISYMIRVKGVSFSALACNGTKTTM